MRTFMDSHKHESSLTLYSIVPCFENKKCLFVSNKKKIQPTEQTQVGRVIGKTNLYH